MGYDGKWATEPFSDLESAISAFQAKRREKKRKRSGYTEIELNYEDENDIYFDIYDDDDEYN